MSRSLLFRLTAQWNLCINRVFKLQAGGAPMHPPVRPLGCYHIACEYCCLTCVLQLPELFNCYLSENKVSIVREPGSALLSPNFTERSPAASNQIDSQGSSPRRTELAGTGPNWPDTKTPYTWKNNCQQKNLKLKVVLYFLKIPKNCPFSSVFAFKQDKNKRCFWCNL